ncbi:hypothetical protein AB0J52_41205 [Spirillospora sp. NPDC049652]
MGVPLRESLHPTARQSPAPVPRQGPSAAPRQGPSGTSRQSPSGTSRPGPSPASRQNSSPAPRQGPAPAGAAALPLRRLLDAPKRPARVIAVFPAAMYLEVRGVPEPRVLAVVAEGAVRLPNAVVLVVPARERPLGVVRAVFAG